MANQALVEIDRVVTAHPRRRPASAAGPNSSASFILGLQRSAGNAAVARHLVRQNPARSGQGHPVAIQRCGPIPCNCSDDERAEYAAKTSGVHGHEDGESESGPSPAAVQRHAADQGETADEDHDAVQRSVAQRMDAARGSGDALDDGSRLRLQRAFGTDLSPVRVHTDGEADSLSRDVGATAFTSGHHIFFRSGAYNPSSTTGFKTLAHEMTHVVQQSTGPVPGRNAGNGLSISDEHDAGEQQAEATATRISAEREGGPGSSAEPTGAAGRGAPAPVQRLKDLGQPARGAVQRLTDPLGDTMVVDWTTPGASVALTNQAGAPIAGGAALNFGGGDSASFTVPDRTASANINFPVTANWHGKGVAPKPPGPNPAPGNDCDPCKVLIDGATVGTCAFVANVVRKAVNVPLLGPAAAGLVFGACAAIAAAAGGAVIKLLPDEILQACKSSNIDELINKVREIKENIEKTSTLTDVIDVIVDELKKIPGLGNIVNLASIPSLIRAETVKRLGVIIEKLKALRDKCKGRVQPNPAGGQGQATSTMKTVVFIGTDGVVRAVGPGPAQNVSGTGATEESPVRFSQDGVPNSALVAQVPTIDASGPNGAKAGRQFTVNILFGLPPAPLPIACPPAEFFPFRVAKDQFEDELDAQKKIRDWFFGHDPEIRNTVHTGASTVKITGRASNTGAVEFNRQLAEKRAQRVEAIVRDLAGTDSQLRAFSTGFLTAQEPGEAGHERRADAQIEGQVPADRVALMKGGDACVGHNNESADQGPSGPQTSPVPGLEGPGSESPVTAGAPEVAQAPLELDSSS